MESKRGSFGSLFFLLFRHRPSEKKDWFFVNSMKIVFTFALTNGDVYLAKLLLIRTITDCTDFVR
jgi:hypothetical protein